MSIAISGRHSQPRSKKSGAFQIATNLALAATFTLGLLGTPAIAAQTGAQLCKCETEEDIAVELTIRGDGLSEDAFEKLADRLQPTLATSYRVGRIIHQLETEHAPARRLELIGKAEDLIRHESNSRAQEIYAFKLGRATAAWGELVNPARSGVLGDLSADVANLAIKVSPPYQYWDDIVNISYTIDADARPAIVNALERIGYVQSADNENHYVRTANSGRKFEIFLRYPSTNRDNIFAPLDSGAPRRIVAFEGHSTYGTTCLRSLAAESDLGDGEGVVLFIGMCGGSECYEAIRARFPKAQIVTTEETTAADSPITQSETSRAFAAMLSLMEKEALWPEINHAIEGMAWNYREWPHFLTPETPVSNLWHSDADRNGKSDLVQIQSWSGPLTKVAQSSVGAFIPKAAPVPADQLEGSLLVPLAETLNMMSDENEPLEEARDYKRVIADGYYDPAEGDDRIVRFLPHHSINGEAYLMQVSSRYAHASFEALRPALAIAYNEQLFTDANHRPLNELERANGIFVAKHLLKVDDENNDFVVWKELTERLGLPKASFHWNEPKHPRYPAGTKAQMKRFLKLLETAPHEKVAEPS
jgi:hypothetical protein